MDQMVSLMVVLMSDSDFNKIKDKKKPLYRAAFFFDLTFNYFADFSLLSF
jgi:hypothetical protein